MTLGALSRCNIEKDIEVQYKISMKVMLLGCDKYL